MVRSRRRVGMHSKVSRLDEPCPPSVSGARARPPPAGVTSRSNSPMDSSPTVASTNHMQRGVHSGEPDALSLADDIGSANSTHWFSFFFFSQVDAGCSVGGSPSAVNTSYLFYGRGPAASGLSRGPRLGRSLQGARRVSSRASIDPFR